MEDVADRADVAKALLYQHFSSKQEMLIALIAHHGDALIAAFAAQQHGVEGHDDLRAGIHAVLAYAQEHPAAWRILFVERFDEPDVVEAQHAVLGLGAAVITSQLRAELGGSVPDHLAEMLAHLARSSVDGLIAWWYEHPEVELDEMTDVAYRYVCRGLMDWR